MLESSQGNKSACHGQALLDDGLPAFDKLPVLYQSLVQHLHTYSCPMWLTRVGGFVRHIERGSMSPVAIQAALGDEAGATAAALAEIAALPLAPAAQYKERTIRLFLLVHRNPIAGLLKIVELSELLPLSIPADLRSNPGMITDAAFAAGRLGLWTMRRELLTAAALSLIHI